MFKIRKNLLDVLHKAVVCTCMGVTAITTGIVGVRMFQYFLIIRPEREAKMLEEAKALLAEGRSADSLPDLAPTLNT